MEEEQTLQLSFTISPSSSSSSSHPLFSCFITLYTLFLIFFPHVSLRIFLSPVLLISGALLFSLLRLGSTQQSIHKSYDEPEESSVMVLDSDTNPDLMMVDFVEWNLRAPLEVIHEAYEEEEEEEDDDDDDDEEEENPGDNDPTRFRELKRFPSLSLCYPESDSESSSEFNFPEIGDWNSPENTGFRWEEEEEEEDDYGIGGEGLIEIKLDRSYNNNKMSKWNQTELDFHAEEDGLIEIDLFHYKQIN